MIWRLLVCILISSNYIAAIFINLKQTEALWKFVLKFKMLENSLLYTCNLPHLNDFVNWRDLELDICSSSQCWNNAGQSCSTTLEFCQTDCRWWGKKQTNCHIEQMLVYNCFGRRGGFATRRIWETSRANLVQRWRIVKRYKFWSLVVVSVVDFGQLSYACL